MATTFDEVEDLALIIVNDYKLNNLYNKDIIAFHKYCDGFLIKAIPNFTLCKQSLEYDLENRTFLYDLTILEKDILSDYWVLEWYTREANNASQIANKLQTTGSFKSHSEAQNMKAKESRLNVMREKVAQKCIDYQLADLSSIY